MVTAAMAMNPNSALRMPSDRYRHLFLIQCLVKGNTDTIIHISHQISGNIPFLSPFVLIFDLRAGCLILDIAT
jgi:hypothetical protein